MRDATEAVDEESGGRGAIAAAVTSPGPAAPQRRPAHGRMRRLAAAPAIGVRRELFWITVVYLSARVALVVAALLLDAFAHRPLQSQFANWDGFWYRSVAINGYPDHLSGHQSNLGFFPLYPIAIHLIAPILRVVTGGGQVWAATYAGVLISWVGGLVATVFVHRLAEGWWDRATARRATVLFVFFPGAVVFSMVYSEALLLPLAAVCIWALERRRWVLGGVMAGLGTAVQPVGLVLGLVCGVCALRELWRHGARSREFAMGLLASVMSATGAVAFLVFLWAWTGHPLATYTNQSQNWGHQKASLLSLVRGAERIVPSSATAPGHGYPIEPNYIVSTVGAVFMFWALWLVWRSRRELSLPAITWTLGLTYFAVTTVPPTPRLLLTMFPLLMVLARWARPGRFRTVATVNIVLFAVLSPLTFYLHVLRP